VILKGVEGAIDYRGKIVAVLDLRQYPGLTQCALAGVDKPEGQ
jgi:chemotaxis signal transduction protein